VYLLHAVGSVNGLKSQNNGRIGSALGSALTIRKSSGDRPVHFIYYDDSLVSMGADTMAKTYLYFWNELSHGADLMKPICVDRFGL
jgi:hypothetical protein